MKPLAYHKGNMRVYWCIKAINENGMPFTPGEMLASGSAPCYPHTLAVHDGQVIPSCNHDGILVSMVKAKRASVAERLFDVRSRFRVSVENMGMWTDVAKRKSQCRICLHAIEVGSKRMAFTFVRGGFSGRPMRMAGKFIPFSTYYVHQTCFADLMFGGRVGEGCPGCSAKILNKEFTDLRKKLLNAQGPSH